MNKKMQTFLGLGPKLIPPSVEEEEAPAAAPEPEPEPEPKKSKKKSED
jgi:hypothetical protein